MTIANQASHSSERQRYSLPLPTKRALNRVEAADYVGVSPSKFDAMVKDQRMPKPKQIDGRRVWDIRQLDRSFDLLPGGDDTEEENPWD